MGTDGGTSSYLTPMFTVESGGRDALLVSVLQGSKQLIPSLTSNGRLPSRDLIADSIEAVAYTLCSRHLSGSFALCFRVDRSPWYDDEHNHWASGVCLHDSLPRPSTTTVIYPCPGVTRICLAARSPRHGTIVQRLLSTVGRSKPASDMSIVPRWATRRVIKSISRTRSNHMVSGVSFAPAWFN